MDSDWRATARCAITGGFANLQCVWQSADDKQVARLNLQHVQAGHWCGQHHLTDRTSTVVMGCDWIGLMIRTVGARIVGVSPRRMIASLCRKRICRRWVDQCGGCVIGIMIRMRTADMQHMRHRQQRKLQQGDATRKGCTNCEREPGHQFSHCSKTDQLRVTTSELGLSL